MTAALRTLLAAYNPRFADADFALVDRWMADGVTVDEIMATVQFWTARKAGIYSLGFFTRYVIAARDARLNAVRPPDPQSGEARARQIAFLVRKLGKCMPAEERWLAAWEAEQGRVEVSQPTKEAV